MAQQLELEQFIEKLEGQFEELEKGTLQADTEFRQLAEWTSMQALIVIASFDWEYGVTISAEELTKAQTVTDLFQLVQSKVA